MDYIIGQKRPQPPAPSFTDSAGAPARPSSSASIVDATQDSFMEDVLDASQSVPVLVDFWAAWCGPCRQLTPVLEKLVTAAAGRVKLVKVDIERNEGLVRQLMQLGLPLQSIPVVAAFWKGQIVDLFQGALPESDVRRFIDTLLKAAGGAMPAEDLLSEAQTALEAGDGNAAAALYGQMLELEPESPDAWGGLIRALIALDQDEEAEAALADVPPKIVQHVQITGARAALELKQEGRKAVSEIDGLQARIAADPNDCDALLQLSSALNAAGKRAEAADALLTIIRQDRDWNEGAARVQLLKFFDAWGNAEPATLPARRKFSAILFS
ncbi:thioredoxin [Ameyamaea chiangmaiensis NBRC 103196]|uniref:Tetratricopeptide repeat protein n=1 Tax=Ameyamaea chiangmaiensis TaxID=442969 RepID=A0A850PA87_9PROT|nr:tetratricopeptide repeat protein [Ameyamaea chiangmaiensis]MBS4075374.1 tetratricopeptide repeat protein [Ameyamaea chiangmaiensis]NVN39863.1 tetratricopeptide repeat protein [Ameyamaea chiangmaiensis]GBQ69989.1 thioredoxin [Ameyamaea chiangmaiensis NBRC 103196]